MRSVISLQSVSQQFVQGKEIISVLDEVSIVFEQGKTYALEGVSGTGKSTILQLLAGLEQPTKGKVLYNDKNISRFSDREHQLFLQTTIGFVFQYPYLIDELSVLENVMLKGLIEGKTGNAAQARAEKLLAVVGMSHKLNALPAALSGGEQQRVALARALFVEPEFLLADEPTAHLDSETKKTVLDLLLSFQQNMNMGLIIATHDEEVAQRMQTRILLHNCMLEESV
jgi:lipoprotein-releasing system ATP-binding protein